MARFNTNFELSLSDVDVIEAALRALQTKNDNTPFDAKSINEVLGNLHSQKTFYRPNSDVYVSG